MKYFAPLSLKDCISLILLFAVGFGWLLIDQSILPATYQRFIALSLVLILLYYTQFIINRPEQVFYYANSIALITILLVVLTSLIFHLMVDNSFSFISVIIWLIAGSTSYLSGFIYLKTRRK